MNEMFWLGVIAGVVGAFILDILMFLGFALISYLTNAEKPE